MSYWTQLLSDVFDPGGFFHDTKSKQESDARWLADYMLQDRALKDQEEAFKYSKEYDQWQKDFATDKENWARQYSLRQQSFDENAFERQFAFNQNQFAQQMDLAKSPVSTVVNDAAKVGVNPMAALGMSAGSASVGSVTPSGGSYNGSSTPSSAVNGSFGVGSVPLGNVLSSVVSSLGSLGASQVSARQSEKESKRSAALREQELKIIREKNRNDFTLGNREMDIQQQNANTNVQGKNIQQQLANANDRMTSLEFQKFAHNQVIDYKNYALDVAKFSRHNFESDREYARAVSEFNKRFDEQVREFDANISTADKDRRQRYITSFVNSVTNLIGDIFFRRGGR